MKNVEKYLRRYSEVETLSLKTFPTEHIFQNCVVIPAYKESTEFLSRFFSSKLAQQHVLMVLVINQPIADTDLSPQQQLFDFVVTHGKVVWCMKNLTLVAMNNSNSAVLVVDRFKQGIDQKYGVGLARKIGADLATSLIDSNHIRSLWIYSTDADASLPDSYFTTKIESIVESSTSRTVAACFNFTHKSDDELLQGANAKYERALRYYVSGLRYANSSYGFFTIGSLLVFKVDAYANVRGFPKRSAGEDFYLLNKLAKLGEVAWLADDIIILEARLSSRVPFGTGPAVKQIIELQQQKLPYCYYHPQLFTLLKLTLTGFESLYENRRQLALWYQILPKEAMQTLINIGFESFIAKQQNSSEKQFIKQVNVWFDAFKTLKFIHAARDLYYPNMELQQAIEQADF
jgi:hypothetical protein